MKINSKHKTSDQIKTTIDFGKITVNALSKIKTMKYDKNTLLKSNNLCRTQRNKQFVLGLHVSNLCQIKNGFLNRITKTAPSAVVCHAIL